MTTLTTYRRALAPLVGPYLLSAAVTGSTTTSLLDTAYPVKSLLDQSTLYEGYWLYRPSAAAAGDRTRVVYDYTPSTGALTPDLAWTNAPANAEAYELHGMFDPAVLNTCINEALKRCWIPVETTLTPTAEQDRHSLSTITWVTAPEQVRQVGYLLTGEDRDEVNPYQRAIRGWAGLDGATVYINHPGRTFLTTTTLYLLCLKRAYDHCKVTAGSYGGQSGLSLETDEAPVAVEWVVAGAMVEAWRRYSQLLEASANQRMIMSRSEAAAEFTRQTRLNFTLPQQKFRIQDAWARSV